MNNFSTDYGRLETDVTFTGIQATGIALSDRGRMFVNFPRWREGTPFSVAEITEQGKLLPYPDLQANTWENGDHADPDKFVCIQSVVAHDHYLYILDTIIEATDNQYTTNMRIKYPTIGIG